MAFVLALLARCVSSPTIIASCVAQFGIRPRQARNYITEGRDILAAKLERTTAAVAGSLLATHELVIEEAFHDRKFSDVVAAAKEIAKLADLYPNPEREAITVGVQIVLPGPKSPEQYENEGAIDVDSTD